MNEEIDVYPFLGDYQIQEKLLEADDEIVKKEVLNNITRANNNRKIIAAVSNSNTNISSGLNNLGNKITLQRFAKEFQTAPMCGWLINPDIIYRKTESEGPSKSKGTTGAPSKESGYSLESKNKSLQSQDFIFQHYSDTSRYIEQYRYNKMCRSTANSPLYRNKTGEPQRFYSCQQHSPHVCFSQTSACQQTAAVPSSQEVPLTQTMEPKFQTSQKQPQIPTESYTHKQQRHIIHTAMQRCKKSTSSSCSPEINRTMGELSDANKLFTHTSDFARESSSFPLAGDVFAPKTAIDVLKMPASNVNVQAKNRKFSKAWSPVDLNTGNQASSYKFGSGTYAQPRLFDIYGCSSDGKGDKQSSGLQAIISNLEAQLESGSFSNKRYLRPKFSQLRLTPALKEERLSQASTLPGHSEVSHKLLPRHGTSSGSEGTSSSYENNSVGSDQQTAVEKQALSTVEVFKQNLPWKERLSLTGLEYGGLDQQIAVEKQAFSGVQMSNLPWKSRSSPPGLEYGGLFQKPAVDKQAISTVKVLKQNLHWKDKPSLAGLPYGGLLKKPEVDKHTISTVKVSEQNVPWKERPLEYNGPKNKKLVTSDSWSVRSKNNERSPLSNNQRVRHLIKQSKLKCKFNQVIGSSKVPPGRSTLQVNNIQILDPFLTGVSDSSSDSNFNNCICTEQSVVDHSSLVTSSTVGNTQNVSNTPRYKSTSDGTNINGLDQAISKDGLSKSSVDKNYCENDNSKLTVDKSVNSSNLCRQPRYADPQTKFQSCCKDIARGAYWNNMFGRSLPENDCPTLASINQCYIHILKEELSEMVGLSVPKVKCSKPPVTHIIDQEPLIPKCQCLLNDQNQFVEK